MFDTISLILMRQPTVALASYALRVWNTDEHEADTVSDFAGGNDLFDFLKEFFSGLKKKPSHNKNERQLLRVKQLHVDGRKIYGTLETGEYGAESEIWDVTTEALAHTRKTTEADMIPFYFHADIPQGVDEGFLVLEKRGMMGMRHTLSREVNSAFSKKFADHTLRFDPLVEAEELEKYVRGKIESVHFVTFDIPKDIAEAFGAGHKEVKGRVELVIHARRGKSLPLNERLRRFVGADTPVSKWIALNELGYEYENVKIKSRVGGSRRTIDLSRLDRLRSYHDISAEVEFDAKSGNPRFDSIHELANKLVRRVKRQVYKENGRE